MSEQVFLSRACRQSLVVKNHGQRQEKESENREQRKTRSNTIQEKRKEKVTEEKRCLYAQCAEKK